MYTTCNDGNGRCNTASDGLDFEMSLDSTYVELAHEFAKTYQQKFVMNNQRLDTYIHELE